jgi:hypothetical protein
MASSLADIPEQRLHPEARTLIRNCTVNCDQIKQLDCIPADAVGQSPLRRHPQREVEEDDNKRLKDGSLDLGGGALSAAAEVERGGGLAQVQQAPAILQATTSLLLPFSTTYSASLQVVSFTWYALSYIRFP